ncbi:hypothetical protein D3C80_1628860 [compost metagenome]
MNRRTTILAGGIFHFRTKETRTFAFSICPDSLTEELRITDILPARNKRASHKTRVKPGLQFLQAASTHMLISDTGLCLCIPTGLRRSKFGFTFIKLQIAIFLQTVA